MGDAWTDLLNGNFFGFLVDCFTTAFVNPDLFYSIISFIMFGVLYIRTDSLLFVGIVYILVGGVLISAMPIVAPLAVFLMVMGIGGMLYSIFTSLR